MSMTVARTNSVYHDTTTIYIMCSVCVTLFHQTDIEESLLSWGFLVSTDFRQPSGPVAAVPDPHPPP